jgi:hypothetical protein
MEYNKNNNNNNNNNNPALPLWYRYLSTSGYPNNYQIKLWLFPQLGFKSSNRKTKKKIAKNVPQAAFYPAEASSYVIYS